MIKIREREEREKGSDKGGGGSEGLRGKREGWIVERMAQDLSRFLNPD